MAPTPLPADMLPTTAPSFDGYTIERRLGGGGFANVWAARRDSDGGRVAIKLGRVATGTARGRFEREADAMAQVGSPYVPALFDRGELPDGRPYLVMELLDGEPLSDHIGRLPGPPPVSWAYAVTDAVLASLEAVHDKKLIHRDLKPGNIFWFPGPPPRAVLLDFGLAKPRAGYAGHIADPDLTMAGTLLGTAEYMAPEQFAGRADIDARSDVYAMGVLLYELLTLRVPFVGDVTTIERGHRSLRPPTPSMFVDVPEPIERVCVACLAKDADRRPWNATALRKRLAEAFAAAERERSDDASRASTRQAGARLLSSAHEPVLLLAVEVDVPDLSLVHVVTRHKGLVARQLGNQYLCAFTGVTEEAPLHAAIAAAREIASNCRSRLALHVANLKVRRSSGARPPKVYGAPVQKPEDWVPDGEWEGLILTPEFADLLPMRQTRPSDACPGLFELVPPELATIVADVSLIGRDELTTRAATSLMAVFETNNPGLFTLLGGSGLGKSRLAREFERRAKRMYPEADVLLELAVRQVIGRPDETLLRLLARLGVDAGGLATTAERARALGEALRARSRHKPMVLILDDAHYADTGTLDAIEYATLDGDGVKLWVAVVAHPRLLKRRPQWGLRAFRHERAELAPLSERAAMKLAAEFLRPVEYVPEAILERLARWTAGSPHMLGELVRTLKREGVIKQRPQTGSWYVSTAALDKLPASPGEQWVASRRLDSLPPELAACVRLCAVLGAEFLRDELEHVQNAAARSGAASSSIDTDVGLDELASAGIVSESAPGSWAFCQSAFQDAIYKLLPELDRAQIHRDALGFWQRRDRADDRVLSAIARHAGASGDRAAAADAHLALGDRARAAFHDVEADQQYSAVLDFTDPDDHARRVHALGERGRVRYRIQRGLEAIADLRGAQDHARALGDARNLADLMLEEATALDWVERYKDSADRTEEARELVEDAADPMLRARFQLALGRAFYRREQMDDAARLLATAAAEADRFDDTQSQIVARILLGYACVRRGRLDEAQAQFETAERICQRVGDRMHQCAVYINRSFLWFARDELDAAMEDLKRIMELARQCGFPQAENFAAYNIGERLFRGGELAEALVFARRCYALQRFLDEPSPADALLLARIHAASGSLGEVSRILAEVESRADEHPLDEKERLFVRALEGLTTSFHDTDWDELVELGQNLAHEDRLELLYFRITANVSAGRMHEAATNLERFRSWWSTNPVWKSTFDELDSRLRSSVPHR